MITKFKIFESISYPYKNGDFLLIRLRSKGVVYENVLVEVISTDHREIKVKCLDDRIEKMFPKDDRTIIITNDYIICWSDNKEELEALINQNRFNL